MTVLLANFLGLISSIFKVLQGYIKTKKTILILNVVQQTLSTITCFLLCSYTGAVNCVLNLVATVFCIKERYTFIVKAILTLILFMTTVFLNTDGLFGWLPFILFSFYMFLQLNTQDMVRFKIFDVLRTVGWCVHDIYYKAYVNVLFNIFTILSNIVGLVRVKKEKYNT